jgi:hypothetical protein
VPRAPRRAHPCLGLDRGGAGRTPENGGKLARLQRHDHGIVWAGVDRHAELLDGQAGGQLVDDVPGAANGVGPLRPPHDRAVAVDDDACDASVGDLKSQ